MLPAMKKGFPNPDAGHTFGFETNRMGFLLQGVEKTPVGAALFLKADWIARKTIRIAGAENEWS